MHWRGDTATGLKRGTTTTRDAMSSNNPFPPDPNQGPYIDGPPGPYHGSQGPYHAPTPPPVVQPYGHGQSPIPKPDSYLGPAILVTMFCFLPFGIVGIVYACQVDSKWAVGDWAGAEMSAKSAQTWTKIGFFCGLIPVLIAVLFWAFIMLQMFLVFLGVVASAQQ